MFLHPARHRHECRRGKHECLRHIWAFVARAPLPAVSKLVSRLAGSTAYAQRAKSKRRWHEILRRVGNAGVSRISGAFDLRGSAERCLASLEDSRQNVPTRGASRASSGVARCLELAKRAPRAPSFKLRPCSAAPRFSASYVFWNVPNGQGHASTAIIARLCAKKSPL